MRKILKRCQIKKTNSGASTGNQWWSDYHEEDTITAYNPSNDRLIATLYPHSSDDYEKVLQSAQQNFLSWRTVPAPKRGELIRQIGDALREKKDVLGSLVALEVGKSKQEGDGEVQEMIDMADLAVGQSRMLFGNTMHSERPAHRMYEQWHPLGAVGIISAFNFPVAVWAWNAFLAVICGNTVIWKPSPKSPLCAIAIQKICNEIMKKNGVTGIFSLLISDDINFSKKFVADKRLPLILFTGSSTVGKKVSQVVAKRMGRYLLECSGNNAVIVDESADLKLAIPAIVFGAIGTGGQRCTTTRRLFVHESLLDEVTEQLTRAYKSLKIGDPLDEKNQMGPLIDQSAADNYLEAIKKAQESGGVLYTGGKRLPQKGYFVEPCLIKAENNWPIVQCETFSPILYIMPFNKLSEAIDLQNSVCQGLSSAIFTNNIKHAELFLSAMGSDCGIANVNIGTSGAEIGGAFGGEKETGGGREAGSDAWKSYMRRQTNTINWSDDLPLAQGINFSSSD